MIFNVHLPSNGAFALPYRESDTLPVLLSRIADKAGIPSGEKIGSKDGWRLKYSHEGTQWSLDDEDDFSILLSRFAPPSTAEPNLHLLAPQTATSSTSLASHLHLPSILHRKGPSSESGSIKNGHGGGSGSGGLNGSGIGSRKSQALAAAKAKELKHQKEFENFHGQNGVRTVLGSIGPVKNVRMLLKAGYRHVYISRSFAQQNGFIPKDAAPGWYGYGGLVNLGSWPIQVGSKSATHTVMLSEESHFDVVLGRSWMEKMGVRTDPLDQTSVILMGPPGSGGGEKVPCDVVVIKDGRGEVVTVT